MKKQNWLAVIVITSIMIGTSGCATTTTYVTKPLTRPERPMLPKITAAELEYVSFETYTQLVTRNRLQREYAETLEAIIDATRTTP